MRLERIKQLFPNASKSTVDLNLDTELQDTVAQRPLRDESLAANKGKAKSTGRLILRYTSYRQRKLDIDNIAGGTKFLTDALRYCGAIQDDTEDEIDLQIRQKKVAKKTEEKTLIELLT